MKNSVTIGNRIISQDAPCFLVAELSANHGGSLDRAIEIVHAAAEAGADAVKFQTYTPDTMTIECDGDPFHVKGGLWDGYSLFQLYREAHTPWEWHEELFAAAESCGLIGFSTAFDASSVAFLERFNPPCYKVASFEIVDLPLLRCIAATGRPVIFSTGMASLKEIDDAVQTLRAGGCDQLIALKCVSSYPADPGDFNIRTIPNLAATFDCLAGLSDHCLSNAVAVGAVALGARVIEKHLTLRRSDGGPDAGFSLEPAEFAELVRMVRDAEKAMGTVRYGTGISEAGNVCFRRSLIAVESIAEGDAFNLENVRVIRPGDGLSPKHLESVIGQVAAMAIKRGTPLTWGHVGAPA